jgi:hypothetical protein
MTTPGGRHDLILKQGSTPDAAPHSVVPTP